jgi:hypothetical protein
MKLFKRKRPLKPDEFVTPDGKVAKLITNDDSRLVYKVGNDREATFYNFDKHTGEKIIRHVRVT